MSNVYGAGADYYDFRQFDGTQSVFAGMSNTVLQGFLASAQTAMINFQLGSKAETVSYAQGDGGTKSVTYTRNNLANLVQLVRALQLQLGIIQRGRRAVRLRY
jgi:hypothetical protein